jgi:hypothetical protein
MIIKIKQNIVMDKIEDFIKKSWMELNHQEQHKWQEKAKSKFNDLILRPHDIPEGTYGLLIIFFILFRCWRRLLWAYQIDNI